jgi:GAF domain-containing protein
MEETNNPFAPRPDSKSPLGAREIIAQSVVMRESSRAARLHRTLEMLLSLTESNPPATTAAQDQLLATILDALLLATEAPMGNLQLFDPATQVLRIRVQRGFSPAFLKFFDQVHEGSCACGCAFAKGQPEVVDDVASSPLFSAAARQAILDDHARAVQSLALVTPARKFGVVSVHYPTPGIPSHKREAFANAAPLVARLVEAGLRG